MANYWEGVYRNNAPEALPWFNPKLDANLGGALRRLKRKGKFLSLGEGPGTQAIALAKMGFQVTATDISETAISLAEQRARRENVRVEFVLDDITDSALRGRYANILDRGCFHSLEPHLRGRYLENVHRLLAERGFLFLKCFDKRETRPGPYRFSVGEIREMFGRKFEIVSAEGGIYEGTLSPPPMTLFFVMRKK